MNTPHWRPSRDPMLQLDEEMRLRGLSRNTRESYTYYVRDCLAQCGKSPREVTAADVRHYLGQLAERGRSASTLNCAYSALQYYFERILHRKFFASIPRSKEPKKLPAILSKEEIHHLIAATTNPKHQCIIRLLYCTGMRVG